MQKVAVIGGGAWGTALALSAARAGRDVKIWARNPDTVKSINEDGCNPAYLPGITFDVPIHATSELEDFGDAHVILLVTPAQTTREVCKLISSCINQETNLILCAKGLDKKSGRFVSEIVKKAIPKNVHSVLSGPSFAIDVAKGLPTAVTLASESIEVATELASLLASISFRPYATDDIVGVQLGGALKNVLAIACGIVKGRELGSSAQSALIARGFAELSRLGRKLGASAETLTGLSGLGDLVLTCSSEQSRNFSFGIEIGQGSEIPHLLEQGGNLVEGVHTAGIVSKLADRYNEELPICEAVSAILGNRMSVDQAMESLLRRPLRGE